MGDWIPGGGSEVFSTMRDTASPQPVLKIASFKSLKGGGYVANIKPAALRTGKTGKEEIAKRKEAEEKLKAKNGIKQEAPPGLSPTGATIYEEVIGLLPEGFLSGGDTYTVAIVSDALDRMRTCQEKINGCGLFEEGFENEAVKTYERYSKIFEKFGSKLGLSPKDRAALAVLNINAEEEKNDPLLQVLRGE